MADLVLGLAKTVVEGLITQARSAIDKDTKLRKSAHNNLVFITNEFEVMKAFLDNLPAEEEGARRKEVMVWVKQLRELASDLEDSIEFVVHLDMETPFWVRVLSVYGLKDRIWRDPLDEAVAEIAQLRERVVELSGRNSRYSIISVAGSQQNLVQQQPANLPGSKSKRKLVFEDLSGLISNKGSDLQVISVFGAGGGAGMVTLIREAYYDPGVSPVFPCRAWVKIMHPFNPRDFIRCLMAQFYANSSQEKDDAIIGVDVITMMEDTQEDLLKDFVRKVNEGKYLIVLEDLPSMVEWEAIRTLLPDRKKGSRIIVSTQQAEIAGLCAGHPFQVLELKKFSARHSAHAYIKLGSQDDKPRLPPDMSPDAAQEWMVKFPLIGRTSEFSELCKYTTDAESQQVVSVWGIAGAGKSTLVRHLYYTMLCDQKFQKFRWVDVSHPFKLPDICRSLLLEKHSEDPIKQCCQLLEDHRCLIVIDGLRSEDDWDLIKKALLKSGNSRSFIIVITNELSIATHCRDKEVLNVKGLEYDAAHQLFINKVPQSQISHSFSPQEREDLEELILKCGGLPKILVAISGLLTTKTATWMETARSINDRFMDHLETDPEFDSLQGLFDRMSSTLRASSDSLKPFIFYLSIFPRDCSLRRRRLLRRWIAEGYSRDSNERDAEENGEIFFSKLLDMGIIRQPPQLETTAFNDKRLVSCQVDGFYREYIISRRMEENLVCELRASNTKATQPSSRHLIIRESWKRDRNVFKSMDFSRLRSMTVFGKWEQFFISKNLKRFRALDLENATHVSDDDLEQMFKMLPRLKFLSLRGCSEISHLHSSLGHLRELQTLDVRHTSVVNLPAKITKLQKLQYIRAGNTIPSEEHLSVSRSRRRRPPVGVKVPRGIGKLIALRTLGVVNISASGEESILKELKQLTQLQKLGVSGINRKNSKNFFLAISDHVRLESLSVQLDKDSQSCLDDINLPLVNLNSLKLYGLEDKLPQWSNQLTKLTKLDLEMETLRRDDARYFGGRDDMMLLGELPKLCILRLHFKQPQGGELRFCVMRNAVESSSYENVKILEIACSSRLNVAFGSNTMKHLELLKVDCCSGSSLKFAGLDHLSDLKAIFLKSSSDAEIKQNLESQIANHPKKHLLKLHDESQAPRS